MTQNTTDESVSSDHQTKQVPESEMGTLDRLTNRYTGTPAAVSAAVGLLYVVFLTVTDYDPNFVMSILPMIILMQFSYFSARGVVKRVAGVEYV